MVAREARVTFLDYSEHSVFVHLYSPCGSKQYTVGYANTPKYFCA